ncbi:hypothetical protein OF83DRAFT_1160628 [Amylostereum chailletii]|nr:hypothetical protein OF83DRAFT_1160628 [Amylostereum chailletii]
MVAHTTYSYPADYWALGITALQMLKGEAVFDRPECKPHVAASAIEIKFRDYHHVDAVAQDFVCKVLAKYPAPFRRSDESPPALRGMCILLSPSESLVC